uniref:AlNc14C21G2199 protein n=1 Tax=Albugo laibachii Nc14 TaxID=890382 RepID=F0W5N4_9STRA|nr:AlNc14C21G2199 [Albugo laibachii Nc14]|eukprot:CCA16425.1 AlNc14C21G2199 [Albugo laibachii Nc14]
MTPILQYCGSFLAIFLSLNDLITTKAEIILSGGVAARKLKNFLGRLWIDSGTNLSKFSKHQGQVQVCERASGRLPLLQNVGVEIEKD